MKPLNDKIVLSAEGGKRTDNSLFFHFISEASASHGGDRCKVIFSPMYFFGSIPGIAVKDYKKIKKENFQNDY